MRVIGGELAGRRIVAPPGTGTRPTTDRVREALVSVIISRLCVELEDVRALDAFAGSGALGIEMLSRGVSHVTFVEKDRRAAGVLTGNIASLGLDSVARVHVADAFSLAAKGVLTGPFSLILLDPPYTLDQTAVSALLAELAGRGGVEDDALVTWEHALETTVVWPKGYEPVATKRYGSTCIDVAVYAEGELST